MLRPRLNVELGFVDVLLPTVEDVLDSVRSNTILVPTLLSSGYHVRTDIPRAARKRAVITRHLGPDPLLTRALVDRLAAARGSSVAGAPVALVSAGSSDPAARVELATAAADLASALGVPVRPATLSDTDLDLHDVEVASYLLTEGTMADSLALRAAADGALVVGAPLASHPAVAELIVARYDEGVST
jgi:sirohydrochlorin ferrochelatase